MKRLISIAVLTAVLSVSMARAGIPELRLSWNRDHKVDLQVIDEISTPDRVKVIEEQGTVVSSHLYSEFTGGRVSFANLPAGRYQLILVTPSGEQIRAERFTFDPDSGKDVTSLTLRLLATGTFRGRVANPANTTGNIISPFQPEQ